MRTLAATAIACFLLIPGPAAANQDLTLIDDRLQTIGETHFRNIRQLTFGGENAEAYFSFDGRALVFQSTRPPYQCDQIFTLDLKTNAVQLVSTGLGRTTCGYFLPDNKRILYSSTHERSPDCPPRPDYSRGYVWPLYPSYDIYVAGRPADAQPRALTRTAGYDAEATIAPDGKRIVFTSLRDGDLELYSMNLDGSDVRRLTFEKGYDGGAFYSPDSAWIVYRAHHPASAAALSSYEQLLRDHLIEPRSLEIFVMRADGSSKRQVTSNGAANFAPFFHPSGRKIIFASNQEDPRGRNFDLYMVDTDGRNQQRITFHPTFDGFPMFSPDGRKLVFASNRNAQRQGETNLFIAEWVD